MINCQLLVSRRLFVLSPNSSFRVIPNLAVRWLTPQANILNQRTDANVYTCSSPTTVISMNCIFQLAPTIIPRLIFTYLYLTVKVYGATVLAQTGTKCHGGFGCHDMTSEDWHSLVAEHRLRQKFLYLKWNQKNKIIY